MDCTVFAVIPVELTRNVIEQIILNGEKLGLSYENEAEMEQQKKYIEWTASQMPQLIDYLYKNSLNMSPQVYDAWVSGSVEEKSGYFLGLARGGKTYFALEKNEFELRFGWGNALYKRDFLHGEFYTDLGWYTQTVLDLTKDLPIKKLHTVLR